MTPDASQDVTGLLVAWSKGDRAALDTTALVNEAYLRMVNQSAVNWQNRAHFFGVSAQVMRNILIDMARKRLRRGGDAHHVSLDEALMFSEERAGELLSLDDALTALGKLDERKGRIVEMRYFGGLSVEETAEVLKVSSTTVDREWKLARVALFADAEGLIACASALRPQAAICASASGTTKSPPSRTGL